MNAPPPAADAMDPAKLKASKYMDMAMGYTDRLLAHKKRLGVLQAAIAIVREDDRWFLAEADLVRQYTEEEREVHSIANTMTGLSLWHRYDPDGYVLEHCPFLTPAELAKVAFTGQTQNAVDTIRFIMDKPASKQSSAANLPAGAREEAVSAVVRACMGSIVMSGVNTNAVLEELCARSNSVRTFFEWFLSRSKLPRASSRRGGSSAASTAAPRASGDTSLSPISESPSGDDLTD